MEVSLEIIIIIKKDIREEVEELMDGVWRGAAAASWCPTSVEILMGAGWTIIGETAHLVHV